MKEKLRKEVKERRKKISKEGNRKKSKKIKEKLFNLKEYQDAKTILFYVSYNGEVFTHQMIKEGITNKKNIIVPISDKKKKKLILSKLKNWNDLSIGSYEILEPKKEKIDKASLKEIDLIIVPGIAFDLKGNRLGHGKGYYDRLLKKTDAVKIALCFEFQIKENIPTDKYDVPVDIIITENKIIRCQDIFLEKHPR